MKNTYSLLAVWNADDLSEGTFAGTYVAESLESATGQMYREMAESLGVNPDEDSETFKDYCGSFQVIREIEGQDVWEGVEKLGPAILRLLNCPDLNFDELDPETRAAIDQAQAALAESCPHLIELPPRADMPQPG